MASDQDVPGRLNQLLAAAGLAELDDQVASKFQMYLDLLVRWNARMNLTAIRDPDGILSRHFLESIACARALPDGVKTLLDFGSGAGFPGIPIALCCPQISVTLAESQSKKAAFLQEAARTLALPVRVFSGRAESIGCTFDCVVLRAVDRMENALRTASALVSRGGWLGVMTSGHDLTGVQLLAGSEFEWRPPAILPMSEDRIVIFGQHAG